MAVKPASASRLTRSRTESVRPHHECSTNTPGPVPDLGASA